MEILLTQFYSCTHWQIYFKECAYTQIRGIPFHSVQRYIKFAKQPIGSVFGVWDTRMLYNIRIWIAKRIEFDMGKEAGGISVREFGGRGGVTGCEKYLHLSTPQSNSLVSCWRWCEYFIITRKPTANGNVNPLNINVRETEYRS